MYMNELYPTIITALEFLLDVTADYLINIQDELYPNRATPLDRLMGWTRTPSIPTIKKFTSTSATRLRHQPLLIPRLLRQQFLIARRSSNERTLIHHLPTCSLLSRRILIAQGV